MLSDVLHLLYEGQVPFNCQIEISWIHQCLIVFWLLWSSWYIFSFYIKPRFRAEAPQLLPYYIPFLGHAFSFLRNPQGLIEYGIKHFNNNGRPFSLVAGGQKIHILSSQEDMKAIFNNNTTVSWEEAVKDTVVSFGMSKDSVPRLLDMVPSEVLHETRSDTSPDKIPAMSFLRSILDLFRRQLQPGPRLETINATLTTQIDELLGIDHVAHKISSKIGSKQGQIPLNFFCNYIIAEAATNSLFAPVIYQIEPEINRLIVDFNKDAWQIVFKYPSRANSRIRIVQHRLLTALSQYLQLPLPNRKGELWLVGSVLQELKGIAISDKDRAVLLLLVYWTSLINPGNVAFWMVSFMMFTPNLLVQIRSETSKAFGEQEHLIDVQHIMKSCPKLEALYHESLRMAMGALLGRKITAPTKISGSVLEAGDNLILPFRQLHFETEAFGQDSNQFNANRFLDNPSLAKSPFYKPYGAGHSYCPGRFLAKQELLLFVAVLVNRYDVQLSNDYPNQKLPEMDVITPSLGAHWPKPGQDVFVDIQPLK